MCTGSTCAHSDGACHERAVQESWAMGWMRKEELNVIIAAAFPMARSQFLQQFTGYFACNAVALSGEKAAQKTTAFDFSMSYEDVWRSHNFKEDTLENWSPWLANKFNDRNWEIPRWHPQMIGMWLVKFVGLHLGQIAFVTSGFIAYYNYMGKWQKGFAWAVVFKELWYCFLLLRATVGKNSRKFLLFMALSETSVQLRIAYTCDPEYFLACCISQPEDQGNGDDPMARATTLRKVTYLVSATGGGAAVLAACCGLFGDGAMFLSLLAGYMVSGLSIVILFLGKFAMAADKRRAEQEAVKMRLAMADARNMHSERIRIRACEQLKDSALNTPAAARDCVVEIVDMLSTDSSDKVIQAAEMSIQELATESSILGEHAAKALREKADFKDSPNAPTTALKWVVKKLGYNASKLQQLCGLTAAQLKGCGFEVAELKDLFVPKELTDAGFGAAEMKGGGFGAAELKKEFPLKELIGAGFDPKDLDFDVAQLKKKGFSLEDMIAVGFSVGELADHFEWKELQGNEWIKQNEEVILAGYPDSFDPELELTDEEKRKYVEQLQDQADQIRKAYLAASRKI